MKFTPFIISIKKHLIIKKIVNAALEKKLKALTNKTRDISLSGGDKTLQWLLELGERIASVDSTVLISGESGVGKDVFAHLVHQLGDDTKPFVKISCGAIPSNLLESELFGYEPGAFTGASKKGKPGIFELAKDGIIFLDEVGELPLTLQVKLLTVLQDRKFFRIGGVKEKKMEARIISATNRHLKDDVAEGLFRCDLYYRLNVIPVHIPPLRERKEDIVPIATRVLEKLNTKNQTHKHFTWDVQNFLIQYQWPGNIRELNNIIERIYVFSPNNKISIEHLPEEILGQCHAQKLIISPNATLESLMNAYEKDIITKHLKSNLTIKNISERLGISSSTLVRKMQKYDLHRRISSDA